jgi:two-component system sensor histidine kinase PilS (NtrC family)
VYAELSRRPAAGEDVASKRLLALILGRVIFVLLLALWVVLFHRVQVMAFASPAIRLLSAAVAVTLVLTLVYITAWWKLRGSLYWLAFSQIQIDLLFWSVIIIVTGGVGSYFTFLFHLSIVISAVYLGDRGVIFTLVLSVASYVLVVLSGLLEWFPSMGSVLNINPKPEVSDLVVALTLDIGSMVLVAVLGWVLAYQVTRAGERITRTQEIFEDLHRLNEAIVSRLPSGLMTTDVDGRIRSINPAAMEIFGRSADGLVGKPMQGVLGISLSRFGEESSSLETAVEIGGHDVWLDLATSPLRDGYGKTIGSLVHVKDVTEQRRLRQKLSEFEKYRALGDLAVGLAHEIRNPLGSISGSIELVKENDGLPEEDKRLLTIIHRETEKIGGLVTSLFNLARPPDPDIGSVALRALVQEIADIYSRDPEARGIGLVVDVTGSPMVLADRDQLGQVLMNLLHNASEASHEKSGEVRIEAAVVEGDLCEIRVLDSGRGLDPEVIDRIFDPYFTTKSYGIGVGLALCREIVERHGGTISMANRETGGAIVTVRLPVA